MRNDYNRTNTNREERETRYNPEDNSTTVRRRTKNRFCLKCEKEFPSKGPHNRICSKCDLMNVKTGATTYSLTLRVGEITEFLQ